ncbi:16S rRNA (uracil(1498)-N(3))-methyltransferase [Actinotalea fermentans]|uniref:Ribosomal RNA small subunit methyltransferase E n=1 Tax=Actinotalea fermentans TaxID=43671 RepID=A0A511YTM7_9CELL|nr:16S rRNA (uracil(1498)-N(3))-methyltransferase [Actinotalea fermentans]KGM17211.1 16S rRNA methyltransferase [Actinotalea fermentans ATCC 43279 = JCM 9966 = DSM 3133]GEN78549.1 ribosomal RNA small subunit methyltransferase E [Actinotalea fermentans]
MSAPVFLAEPGMLDGYGPGSAYVLDGAEARHAGVVQRRRAGERVDVADGAGVRLECVVATVEPGRLELDVLARHEEAAPGVRLVLAQALAKGDRDELAIEAATEVGVDEVVPWQAERSVVVWRGDRAAKSRARWLATVREATKQSRRARLPHVAHALDTAGLTARVRAVVGAGGTALVLDGAGSEAIATVALPDGAGATPAEVLVVVGPEGGISDGETAVLVAAGAVVTRLGPTVLRTSTAGPVAVAMLAQRLGRWA